MTADRLGNITENKSEKASSYLLLLLPERFISRMRRKTAQKQKNKEVEKNRGECGVPGWSCAWSQTPLWTSS